MNDIVLTRLDEGVMLQVTLLKNSNEPYDLSDVEQIETTFKYADGTTLTGRANVLNATNGTCYIMLTSLETDNVGLVTIYIRLIGNGYNFFTNNNIYLYIKEQLS